jgi:hypothetical protein
MIHPQPCVKDKIAVLGLGTRHLSHTTYRA